MFRVEGLRIMTCPSFLKPYPPNLQLFSHDFECFECPFSVAEL